jgi:hypothetical protein
MIFLQDDLNSYTNQVYDICIVVLYPCCDML